MTALKMLRDELNKHPASSDLYKLIAWAELHIGDQFDRICELEEEIKELAADNERRCHALNQVRALLNGTSKYILDENFDMPVETFARDLAPWRNIMAANGMKPDGSEIKKTKKIAE